MKKEAVARATASFFMVSSQWLVVSGWLKI
jgi:hypothetical protein